MIPSSSTFGFYFRYLPTSSVLSSRNPFFPNSDPYVVIVLALVFIASIFFLHITARIFKALTS